MRLTKRLRYVLINSFPGKQLHYLIIAALTTFLIGIVCLSLHLNNDVITLIGVGLLLLSAYGFLVEALPIWLVRNLNFNPWIAYLITLLAIMFGILVIGFIYFPGN